MIEDLCPLQKESSGIRLVIKVIRFMVSFRQVVTRFVIDE
jgi:hypothetical protein